jgi:hypothetical protein
VTPPPISPPVEPAPAATAESWQSSERRVDVGRCARHPALSSPDREVVPLRLVAGVRIPDIVAAPGVTPAAIRLAQYLALSGLQPPMASHQPLGSGWCCCPTPGPSAPDNPT